MSRFKVGDKVKLVRNLGDSEIPLGSIGKILRIDQRIAEDFPYLVTFPELSNPTNDDDEENGEWFGDKELVKPNQTIKNLPVPKYIVVNSEEGDIIEVYPHEDIMQKAQKMLLEVGSHAVIYEVAKVKVAKIESKVTLV